MPWREFEILGAYRDSGDPARLQVEAATEADAADFAASKGILISEVIDRSAEREQRTASPGPTASNGPSIAQPDVQTDAGPDAQPDAGALVDPESRHRSGSRHIPNVPMLEGERVLATFEAKPAEIGLRGIVFGSRRSLTLTNQRLIAEERSLFNAGSTVVLLSSIDTTRVGPHLWILQLIVGSMISASFMTLFVISAVGAASIMAFGSGSGMPGATDTSMALLVGLGMLPMFAGVALTRSAFRRFVGVDAHGKGVGIYLRRVRGGRIEPFMTALSQALQSSAGTGKSGA